MSDRTNQRVRASIARDSFADTLNRVAYRGERIVLERHGKPVAALVPLDDLDLLEQLEDQADTRAAAKARRERGSIAYDELRRKARLKSAREAGVGAGSEVDLSIHDGDLVVKPVKRRTYQLAELLRKITARNLHEEADPGGPVGREVW